MIPVVLDCDPGHDDMVAILLAAASPALDLRAITTVGGNGSLEAVTRNALLTCTHAGIADVPVAAGCAHPLERRDGHGGETATAVHGESALDGADLGEPTVELDGRHATELIADVLREADEPVTLIPTGPLTNIALVLRRHRDLRPKIRACRPVHGGTAHDGAPCCASLRPSHSSCWAASWSRRAWP